MAINARDMPITREMVHEWLQGKPADDDLEAYLRTKVSELNLADEVIFVPGTDNDTIHIVDYMLEDMASYG
jgi:hypothetical protein